jgi:cyclophilin family peptidyl-prolyl cis-trans isomerase
VVKPRVKVAPPTAKPKLTRRPVKPAPGPKVVLETNMGKIIVQLNPAAAPATVRNFLAYVKSGFYNGTIFHRVIDSFMIQGGGYNQKFRKKRTRAPIKLEAQNGLSNARGTIAMARTGDPNSATSQFFINVVDNKNLDSYGGGYAVFGRVITGMNVVDKIRKLATKPQNGQPNAPVKTVVIRKAKLTR